MKKNTSKNTVIDPTDFSPFTCSRTAHLERFTNAGFDRALYGKPLRLNDFTLKNYQDLLVFSFIKQVVPPGARILEVGGGRSRLMKYFRKDYQCWNVDKMEGRGNGPRWVFPRGYRLIKAYIGDFCRELPDNYFDLVFSISVLEHIPQDKAATESGLFDRIADDLDRVLKPGGHSLHCFDCLLKPDGVWCNHLLPLLFQKKSTAHPFIPFHHLATDGTVTDGTANDLFVMGEALYNKKWRRITGKDYAVFGKPFSYNILWKK